MPVQITTANKCQQQIKTSDPYSPSPKNQKQASEKIGHFCADIFNRFIIARSRILFPTMTTEHGILCDINFVT